MRAAGIVSAGMDFAIPPEIASYLAELYRALAAIARYKLAVAEPRHLTIPSATGDVP